MGCASSKKRTTSIDDLTKGNAKDPVAAPPPSNKSKNGQVATNDSKSTPPIMRETAKQTNAAPPPVTDPSGAIQIPGAHKSFLAPDGIPFIDEDVDDDVPAGGAGGDSSIPIANNIVSVNPDINKNVVKEPTAQPAPSPPPQAVEVKSPTVVAVEERHLVAEPVADHPSEAKQTQQSEEDKAWASAVDVFSKDLEVPVITENETRTSATEATVTSVNEHVEYQFSAEQQQAAAVKIQAGIRGYRDRQKVKAIRAAKQTPEGEPQADDVHDHSVSSDQHHQDYHVDEPESAAAFQTEDHATEGLDSEGAHYSANCTEHDISDPVESDDPDKQRAAVKIQASFKGWKTRKELGKVPK